jgi:hypothetical protein
MGYVSTGKNLSTRGTNAVEVIVELALMKTVRFSLHVNVHRMENPIAIFYRVIVNGLTQEKPFKITMRKLWSATTPMAGLNVTKKTNSRTGNANKLRQHYMSI